METHCLGWAQTTRLGRELRIAPQDRLCAARSLLSPHPVLCTPEDKHLSPLARPRACACICEVCREGKARAVGLGSAWAFPGGTCRCLELQLGVVCKAGAMARGELGKGRPGRAGVHHRKEITSPAGGSRRTMKGLRLRRVARRRGWCCTRCALRSRAKHLAGKGGTGPPGRESG